MDLRLLEYFLVLCQYLNFTKSAEALNISQPTLSQQIATLESRLGIKLFKRVGKKVHITEAGTILQGHAVKIFKEIEDAKRQFNEINGLQRGHLTIGCSGHHILRKSLVQFYKKYPQLQLSIVDMPTETTVNKVVENSVDVGITFQPSGNYPIVYEPLFDEEFYLVTSIDHPWSTKKEVKLKSLDDFQLILLTHQFSIRQFLENEFNYQKLTLKTKLEVSSLDYILELVKFNIGSTILPKSFLNQVNITGLSIIPIIEPQIVRSLGLIYRNDSFIDITMRTFIDHIKEHLKVSP